MRRAALGVALVLAAAGCGADTTPPRLIGRVSLPRPPLADALAKQAELARLGGGELGPLLDRLKTQPTLSLPSITRDGVTLRDVAIRRRGDRVAGEATASEDELANATPGGVRLRYAPGGPGLTFRGSKQVLGVDVDVTVHIVPEDGAVVAEPEGLPVGRTVLLDDPRVRVDGLSGRRVPGGLRLRAVGTLR